MKEPPSIYQYISILSLTRMKIKESQEEREREMLVDRYENSPVARRQLSVGKTEKNWLHKRDSIKLFFVCQMV